MRGASKTIRWACLGLLPVWLPIGSALPATASRRHSPTRDQVTAIAARGSHPCGYRHRSRSRRADSPSYLLASARIPSQLNAGASPPVPQSTLPIQDEQRIPRQASRQTAALQGIIRDTSTRRVVGAMIVATNRATGATRTISADADGVFRFTDLAPGSYLLLVQSDGFENLTRGDLLLNAGDVVTIELTLAPSSTAAARPSRLPRMVQLGPPAPAIESGTGMESYREMRRSPDAKPVR